MLESTDDRARIPQYHAFLDPTLQAVRALGGSGTIDEINSRAIAFMGLSDSVASLPHGAEGSGRSEVEYRMAWARTYLKKAGLINNSDRGVWALTAIGRQTEHVDGRKVFRDVGRSLRAEPVLQEAESGGEVHDEDWRACLSRTLSTISPDAFERLVQRLLRESGFVQVEVTGRSGDGGIDGKGIMRLGGLLSFHVVFQAKRWKGTVGAATIRDFRGAMIGRADKGILITTGDFTPDAQREASRDGAPPVDLVDGEQLMDKLKQLSLGVTTKPVTVEQVTVDEEWFAGL